MKLTERLTSRQLADSVRALSQQKFHFQKRFALAEVEKKLNAVCLTRPKTPKQDYLYALFDVYAAAFDRVLSSCRKEKFSADKVTRLESLCRLVGEATAFSKQCFSRAKKICLENVDLTQKEKSFFDVAYTLEKCRAYAESYFSESDLRAFCSENALFADNDANLTYAKKDYFFARYVQSLDCTGNFASSAGDVSFCDTRFVFRHNSRNVCDGFSFSAFGAHGAEFFADTTKAEISLFAFFTDRAVKNYVVKAKTDGIFSFEMKTDFSSACQTEEFLLGDTPCFALKTKKGVFYTATTFLFDDGATTDGKQSVTFRLKAGQQFCFSLFTCFADSVKELSLRLEENSRFAENVFPFGQDKKIEPVRFAQKLTCSQSNLFDKNLPNLKTRKFDFRFDGDVSALFDSRGAYAPLFRGFIFGAGGVHVYSLSQSGGVRDLLYGAVTTAENGFSVSTDGATLAVSTGEKQIVDVNASSGKTLICAVFEKESIVKKDENTFVVDGVHPFSLTVEGKINSFTTNVFECSPTRLRQDLSCDLSSGQCIAVVASPKVRFTFSFEGERAPQNTPLLSESVLSTCLNYLNGKNVFSLFNKLKKADALTLAAICYTNPSFVKNFITETFTQSYVKNLSTQFYNKDGVLTAFRDEMLLPLAAIYYTTLTGDKSVWSSQFEAFVKNVFFFFDSKDENICIKALALKKYARIFDNDRVRVLSLKNKLEEKITSNRKLYRFAQSIGAVEMLAPSKQRLKELFAESGGERSFYYVSQLENLYGFSLICGKMACSPCSDDFSPEDLAINFKGKKISAAFEHSGDNRLVLNGITSFQSVNLSAVQEGENSLIVRY